MNVPIGTQQSDLQEAVDSSFDSLPLQTLQAALAQLQPQQQQVQPLSPSMSDFLEVLEHLDSQLSADWTLQAPWTTNPFPAGLDLLNPVDRAEFRPRRCRSGRSVGRFHDDRQRLYRLGAPARRAAALVPVAPSGEPD